MKWKIFLGTLIGILVVGSIALVTWIYPKESAYKEAVHYVESGSYVDAYMKFVSLEDYKDSTQQAVKLAQAHPAILLNFKKVKDIVTFGEYRGEAISWIVLEKDSGKMLLLSEKIIERDRPYNDSKGNITWENCSMRHWLNNQFKRNTFSEAERASLIETKLLNPDNATYGTPGGNDTTDFVFLLSLDELSNYEEMLGSQVKAIGTDWANKLDRFVSPYVGKYDQLRTKTMLQSEVNSWYLRSPGENGNKAVYVYTSIIMLQGIDITNKYCGVRPAIWVDLNS